MTAPIAVRWRRFLGPRLGLARELFTFAVDPDDAHVHQVLPDIARIERLLGHKHPFDPNAGGCGLDLARAVDRAMGEMLERYAAYAYRGVEDREATYDELQAAGERVLCPPRCYSDAQLADPDCRMSAFDRTAGYRWTLGTDLLDGHAVWLPLQLVSLGYRRGPREPAIMFATSSGCAVGASAAGAVLGGLLELIERDAFMVRWYARQPPPHLPFDASELLDGRWRTDGLRLDLLDLTLEGSTPVVAATCREASGRACAFAIGAAARVDLRTAIAKAVLELAQSRPFVKTVTRQEVSSEPRFDDLETNVRFFGFSENARHAEWFLASTEISARARADAGSLPDDVALRVVLADCERRGVRPIAIDLTTDDMRAEGLVACRVVAPELVHLTVPRWPPLGHPRLAGRRHVAEAPDWIPHPFP